MKKVSIRGCGQFTVIAGPPLSGKTTTAAELFSRALFLGFAPGAYFPKGSFVHLIESWSHAEDVLVELSKEEVVLSYKTIIIDDLEHAFAALGEENTDSFIAKVLELKYNVVLIAKELSADEN